MVISEVLEDFRKDYIAVRCLSKSTDDNYRDAIKCFIKYIGDEPVDNITPQTVVEWRRRLERGHTAGCTRAYLSKLKNVLIYANKKGHSHFDITEFHLPKVAQSLPKYLTPDEITSMIDAAKSIRNKALISFLFSSGIRAGELQRLDRDDIQGRQVYIRQGKGNTSRTVFIDDRTIRYLNAYLKTRTDKSPILFYSYRSGRLTNNTIRGIIKMKAEMAGIDRNVTTHMMRHSFATNLIKQGCDISFVQKFLGHQFVSTTQLYIHLGTQDLENAYNHYQNVY